MAAPSSPVAFDAEFLSAPYATYARLRGQAPVHRAITPDGSLVWLVTRYADVRAALADSRLSVDKAHSATGYRGFSLPPALDANLLNRDGADHSRLRSLVNQAFTPRRVRSLRGRIQVIADDIVDALPNTGAHEEATAATVDLISSWAAPFPIAVICELLGIPPGDRPNFRAWTDQMLAPDPSRPESVGHAVAALQHYMLDLVEAKRGEPDDDLLSALIGARDVQDQLSENELMSAAFLILFAGYENTVHLLGNGMAALLTQPDQLEAVRGEPERIEKAVEELLRFDPPPQLAIRRFATVDVDIAGTAIPSGDTVMLSLASAHRDPAVFSRPDTFDISRGEDAAVPHLGFGHGRHFCPGASLARLEAAVGLSTLLRRMPNVRLAVEPDDLDWRPSFRNRGLVSLPVSV